MPLRLPPLPLLLLALVAPMLPAKEVVPKADTLARDLLRDAEFQAISISPDGTMLAISRRQGEVTQVTIHKREPLEPIITFDPGPGGEITTLRWIDNRRLIIGATRIGGYFKTALFEPMLTIASLDGTRPFLLPGNFYSLLEDDPDHILVYGCGFAKGADGCAIPEVRKVDLKHVYAKGELIASGPADTSLFIDPLGKAGMAFGVEDDGTTRTHIMNPATKAWTLINDSSKTHLEVYPLAIRRDGSAAILQSQRTTGPDVIESLDPITGERTQLYADAESDPVSLAMSFDGDDLLGAFFEPTQPRLHLWQPEHPDSKTLIELQGAFPGKRVLGLSRSKDRNLLVLYVYSDRDPGSFYLFDRKARKASIITRSKPWIDPAKQATQRGFSVKARDGQLLHGLLTTPPNSSGKNLPLVVLPHGGPYEISDNWGYDEELQILGQHGYAVLQVNFRGSGGYGRHFMDIGERQWGRAMQDDISDATRWAIAQGIADPARICIFGASYGGYAAMMGPIREPGLYRCAVGLSGVYDLGKMYRWGDIRRSDYGQVYLKRVLGEDQAELAANSPALHADKIGVPVLLAHGVLDGRVDIKHAQAMEKALRKGGKSVELIKYSATGHSITVPKHRLDFYAHLLAFLDKHIGDGRAGAAAAVASP